MVTSARRGNMGKIGSLWAIILGKIFFAICQSVLVKSAKLFSEKVLRNGLVGGLILKKCVAPGR